MRIIKYSPKHRPNESDGNQLFDEEGSIYSVTTEDIFDNTIAGLINQPDVAPKEPARVRLPSVEEFRLEDSAAINMASKLVPDQKPRIKSRRPRYRSLNSGRWQFPNEQDGQNDERDADRRDLRQPVAAPRGNVRGLFWSICASILIVMGASAFGFVQPLNDMLPERMRFPQ